MRTITHNDFAFIAKLLVIFLIMITASDLSYGKANRPDAGKRGARIPRLIGGVNIVTSRFE
jgi:hypothetical protein